MKEVKKEDIAESFLLFTIACMVLIGRYDWLSLVFEKLGIDIVLDSDKINEFPCSNNFKANFWRLSALCMHYEIRNKSEEE